ncbi:MAG TPA: Cof-type HAD-IIB family hydrolase [Ktedonobacteraceae bacterium]|nr:Cof-type HAD-IIB family hydrolase [Ktedonobacteraceae bacterium]
MQNTRPASIRMLVIDIDGTLLNPKGKITERTLAAVRAARSRGVIVALATARRYGNTRDIARELGFDLPLVLYDGAMLVQYPQQSIISTQSVPAAIAQQAVDILVRHGIQPVVHPNTGLDEQIWTGPAEFDNVWIEAYFATFPELMHRLPYDQLCAGKPDPLRVVAFASEEAVAGIMPEIAALNCSWNSIRRGSYNTAELVVMRRGCSKASGVEELARHFAVSLAEVMTIGDNTNDIPMLQAAGWSVAMGHAPERVRASAKALTASNREDGAALAIERYVL